VSGATAKSIVYLSSSFLHEMVKKEDRVRLPFFTENQALFTTKRIIISSSDGL